MEARQPLLERGLCAPPFCMCVLLQAARDIASTISHSANRVFLNADSLMLNIADTKPAGAAGK